MSESLPLQGLKHNRLPCPSPAPTVYSNSCPLCRWHYPTISSSVLPFSSHLQSFPASGSFPMSQFFTSHGQSIRISASASVLPVNSQDWFPLELTGLISLQSRVFSNTTIWKHEFFCAQPYLWSNSHICTWVHEYWKKSKISLRRSLLAKQYLCFLIHCLGLSDLFFQETSVF